MFIASFVTFRENQFFPSLLALFCESSFYQRSSLTRDFSENTQSEQSKQKELYGEFNGDPSCENFNEIGINLSPPEFFP
jgi:hypothetical protein